MPRCEGTTQAGKRCRRDAGPQGVCHLHDPHGEKPGPAPKVTEEQVAEALERSGGLKAVAARLLSVDWSTIHRAVQRWPALQEIITESRETILDEAEVSLRALVRGGNLGAICFTLKCQGKSRGWVEKQSIEHTGPDDGPIEVVDPRKQPKLLPVEEFSIELQAMLLEELEAIEAKKAAIDVNARPVDQPDDPRPRPDFPVNWNKTLEPARRG